MKLFLTVVILCIVFILALGFIESKVEDTIQYVNLIIAGESQESIVSVDSPWEDFLPSPLSDTMYWLIATFVKK